MARIYANPFWMGGLASTAIPPWFAPVEKDAQLIIDGGILSNLPIEPALTLDAAEIIALNLMNDPASLHENVIGATQQLEKLASAVLQRQACVETALAKVQGVPMHYIQLRSSPPIPIWDFSDIEISSRLATTLPVMRLPIGGNTKSNVFMYK